jgi:hypothetical protein
MLRKTVLFLTILLIMLSVATKPALALEANEAGTSAVLKLKSNEELEIQSNIRTLESFLKSYNSTLSKYAEIFVEKAHEYGIDWRLVAAIAGMESTFGKHMIPGTYNAYGWASGIYKWSSWEDSIAHVSRVLGEKYYGRGLNTPAKIAPVYAPPSKIWAKTVGYFMEKIENGSTKIELTI